MYGITRLRREIHYQDRKNEILQKCFDAMTSLYNEYHLEEMLEREESKAEPEKEQALMSNEYPVEGDVFIDGLVMRKRRRET